MYNNVDLIFETYEDIHCFQKVHPFDFHSNEVRC